MSAIRDKKIEMIHLGEQYGLLHQNTIRCSQELDDLLNQHLSNKLT
ncbi:MAG TPA: aspartyl-phosphate phosphatase Spo0E family protein [Bacillota bacterium]|nr:aspartyl-phosphate phosphatase Spo0E family protein [Bacillota bacterium]